MNKLHGKWTISKYEICFNVHQYFDTKEEAIKFGKTYEEFGSKDFYVGQVESIEMKTTYLGDLCIEYIRQLHHCDDGECAEEYLTNVETGHIQELDKLIEKVVLEWATEHDYHPKHFLVKNVERVEYWREDKK